MNQMLHLSFRGSEDRCDTVCALRTQKARPWPGGKWFHLTHLEGRPCQWGMAGRDVLRRRASLKHCSLKGGCQHTVWLCQGHWRHLGNIRVPPAQRHPSVAGASEEPRIRSQVRLGGAQAELRPRGVALTVRRGGRRRLDGPRGRGSTGWTGAGARPQWSALGTRHSACLGLLPTCAPPHVSGLREAQVP